MPSQPTRRNGPSKPSNSPSNQSSAPTSKSQNALPQSHQAATMPSLITLPELFLAVLYPSILALGSLTSLLSPLSRSSPYSPELQSHVPHLAPNYFARKSNVFNLYFVKVAWAWYTAAFVIFLLAHPRTGPPVQNGFMLTRRRLQALARYAAATTWWTVVTQWFFGPPLIDRGFRFSGGRCEIRRDTAGVAGVEMGTLVTASSCKMAGGIWKGGHDISGHVFILILGGAFLLLEVWPVLGRRFAWGGVEEVAAPKQDDNDDDSAVAEARRDGRAKEGTSAPVWFLVGVAGLSWWMLLMTATYFHTWVEKVSQSFRVTSFDRFWSVSMARVLILCLFSSRV